jgi:hypothetical protein
MATKLTDLAALGGTPAADDLLTIVDVSDTTGGATAGTSKKITYANLGAGGIMTQIATTVNNAAVLNMKYDDTPITLVAATAGKIHVPVSVTIVATGAGSAESSSDDLRLGWDAATSASSDYIGALRDFMNGISSGVTTYNMNLTNTTTTTAYPASAVNKPLQLWCNDVFNGGWSMVVYTTYHTITV